MSSQVLIANEVFATNKFNGIEGSNELIEKCEKLLKTRKLSKSGNLKSKSLSKSKRYLALKYILIFLRLYSD